MITDAQVHMFAADSSDNPWPKEPSRTTPPQRHPISFGPEEMLGAMEAIGVDRAVIVPPGWAGDDMAPAISFAARYPGRFAIMGKLDPYGADTLERLETWLKQPHMIGLRMAGRWGSSERQLRDVLRDEDPALEPYWSACERLHIPIMMNTGALVGKLDPIATRHPELTLIVDHLSAQFGETAAQSFASMDDLVALARHPRVYIKVGTGPNRSQQSYPFADVHPYLKRVYDAFGPRRMLWEADLTQLTKNTYAECLRLWQEGLPFVSSSDLEWILGRTAAEVLNWPES